MLPEDADGGELAARRPRDGDALRAHAAKGGLRATCSPAATASSPPMKRSRTSSTRCSTSTRSGWRSAEPRAVARAGLVAEILLSPRRSGGRITTASRTRTRASSTWSTNKSAEVCRIYLPPDANTLLVVADHCLRSTDYVNVIVSDKQKHLQYIDDGRGDRALHQGHRHLGRASNDEGDEPDVVMASGGDIPTQEALAAVVDPARASARSQDPLRQRRRSLQAAARERASARPDRSRFRRSVHHGQADHLQLPRLPVADSPADVRATNHDNMHVRGYKEKGNINTPLDLAIHNQIDRFQPGDRRDRPRAQAARESTAPARGDGGRDHREPGVRARPGARPAGDRGLDLAGLGRTGVGDRQERCGLPQYSLNMRWICLTSLVFVSASCKSTRDFGAD